MPTQFQFDSKQHRIAQSNAENFYRAKSRTHDAVHKSGREVTIENSEIDIIRSLSEFNLLDSANSVEFHLWDDAQPDVIVHTDHRIPEEPQPISEDKIQRHSDIKYWLEAIRSEKASDRKKALQAISRYPNDFPESVDVLVPTLIDALENPNLTLNAKQAIGNIADKRAQAVQSYIDRIKSIQQNKNALVSKQASNILEQLEETRVDDQEPSSTKENQTNHVIEGENKGRSTRKQEVPVRPEFFIRKVKEAYDHTCAVCGKERYTPDGNPEVESAHIRSVGDDGPDSISNGIALCKLHHWAFDNGWISIDDEFVILIKDAPETSGFDDFIQYADQRISLPDKKTQYPEQEFLEHHRRRHGF